MNRYLNRCSWSTMYSHWMIYFRHFYRWSWAFEQHQLFPWPDVTKIRYVYVPTSTRPVLNHSFFACFSPIFIYFLFINKYSGFVLYSMALCCKNVPFELNVTKKCPFTHSLVREKKIDPISSCF